MYWPASPPPSLQSCTGLLRNFVFVISRNFVFRKIFLEFCKNQNYFVKISCFVKFWQNIFYFQFREITKKECLQQPYSYTICHLLLNPPLPSTRRFFNAVRQCYFDMKTNKEPCFSILSSIFLWAALIGSWSHNSWLLSNE